MCTGQKLRYRKEDGAKIYELQLVPEAGDSKGFPETDGLKFKTSREFV